MDTDEEESGVKKGDEGGTETAGNGWLLFEEPRGEQGEAGNDGI